MAIATRETTRTVVLAGRLDRDKILSRAGLGFTLLVAAVLNLWNLSQNGYGNTYYAVAVQSMLQNFHNFFYGAYDAGGFITVDKPPVALWIQTLSAKLLGFSGVAILLPEALAGVAAVGLVYFLVRRTFGTLAGFVAALALALTPIAVAVERDNQTDPLLLLALLLAACAITRAAEKGRLALLLLGVALAGVAFNIKMLEAFIVLPTFYLLYLLAAPLSWPRRVLHLSLASVVLFGVALSWPLAVDLTPANLRPWVGGSPSNSVLQLALGYNGLGRVTGQEGAGGPGGRAPGNFGPGAQPGASGAGNNSGAPTAGNNAGATASGNNPGFGPGANPPNGGPGGPPNNGQFPGGGPGGPGGGGGGMFGAGVAGPLRLVGSELADQWSWLLPLAAFGLVVAGLGVRRRLPLERRGQGLLLWTGWLLTYAVVFSAAQGIFHTYYLVMLAPAAAALVGIGVATLWRAYRQGGWRAWLLPAALLATAAWQVHVLSGSPQWGTWLIPLALFGSVLMALPLLAARLLAGQTWRRVAPALVGGALVVLLVAPAAWAVTPALAAGNGLMPQAGPSLLTGRGGFGGPGAPGGLGEQADSGLVSYLAANQAGYFYLVAMSSANQASSIALATGQPVLAMGGFTGDDPAMTVAKLQQLIAARQVRFIMTGGGPGGGSSSVTTWVQAHCTTVDSSQYGGTSAGNGGGGGPGGFGGNGQLYTCAAQ